MGGTVGCARCVSSQERASLQRAPIPSDGLRVDGRASPRHENHRHADRRLRHLPGRRHRPISGLASPSRTAGFFTDPRLIAAYEKTSRRCRIDHVNPLNRVRYKDDATILAWEDMQHVGLISLPDGRQSGGAGPSFGFGGSHRPAHQLSPGFPYHLISTPPDFSRVSQSARATHRPTWSPLNIAHWDALLGTGEVTTAATFSRDAALVTGHAKAFIVNEFGWDRTDWKTPQDLQTVLDTLARDPNVSGDDLSGAAGAPG